MKKKLECKLGLHDREVIKRVKCSAIRSDFFGASVSKVDAVVIIKRCIHCGVLRADLTDGVMSQALDVDYVLAHINLE
jgi:hypothetical protein